MDSTFSIETPAPVPASPTPELDLEELKTAAEQALKEAKVKFDALLKEGQAYIKQNPGKAVVAALGVGIVLGMVFKD